MPSRYENLTVALATPLAEQGRWSFGTGVPVAQGLVMTARHVVCPPDPAAAPVRLRFWHATERDFAPDPARERNGFVNALPDPEGDTDARRGVAWSSEVLDVALVRVPHPASVGVAVLSAREPYDDAAWRTEAFPDSLWEDGEPVPVRLTGRSHSRFPGRPRFQVDAGIEMVEPGDAVRRRREGWSGASGAALFVQGQVLGVLIDRRPGGAARILEGVPAADCLAVPEFRALLGLAEEDADPFRAALVEALSPLAPMMRGRLCGALGTGAGAEDADLAAALRGRPMAEGLDVLATMLDGADAQDRVVLTRIALCLAAAKCCPPDLAAVRRAVFEPQGEIDSCASGSRMGAEFLMAAAEARVPEFRTEGHRGVALPPGRYALPQLPESGSGNRAAEAVADVEARIGADLMHTEAWLDESMGPVTDFPPDTAQTRAIRREILQQELAWRARPARRRPSYYFAELDPGRDRTAERRALQARIDAIRREYPQIGAVYIQKERQVEETARFRPLREIIVGGQEHG